MKTLGTFMVRHRFVILASAWRRVTIPHDSADRYGCYRRVHSIHQDGWNRNLSWTRQTWLPSGSSGAESGEHEVAARRDTEKMWYRGMANMTGERLKNSNRTALGLDVERESPTMRSGAKAKH